ncbi:FUSC family protein [Amycolatopsis sp. cg13]|uniref:FUSC family protein n=1 Tax=Amycolatopsis sp. cg13 TaxID=3238807 RepID=UPI0035265FCB
MDWVAFRDAARRGMQPGKPFQDPLKLTRVAVGMLIATVVGYLLHDPEQQLLVVVGAFLGTIAAVMPHNRSRIAATLATSAAQIAAAGLGVLVSGNWALILAAVFVLFLVSGLLRAVAIGISMRLTVVTIVFLAFAEISAKLTASAGQVVAFFAVGFAIMNLAQLLPPYESQHSAQRGAVAGFYRAIASGRAGDSALLAADRSLALLRWSSHHELDRLTQLVVRGEEIGQLMRALGNRADDESARWQEASARQLVAIASAVSRTRTGGSPLAVAWPGEPSSELQRAVARAVDAATRLAAGEQVAPASDERHTPSSFELIADELRWGSPILHHALRLAIVCVVAQVAGMAVGSWLGSAAFLAGHGFWVVVAAALIVFPDYGSTFARGIGRSLGTVAGAVAGVALSFLPYVPALHAVVLLLLFCGYLAFRSCGQPYTMFWVVAWIGSLTPGPLGATTRGLDTIIGCLLAFAAYLLAPTWHRRLLTERLAEWAEATARQIDALVLLWAADDEMHRLAAGHAVVRTRLTALEFTAAARGARLEPRDRHGRWENDALDPAVDAVTSVRRQIAALSALAPAWNAEERTAVTSRVEAASRDLDAIARAPVSAAQPGDAEGTTSEDTTAALGRLRDAVAALETLAAAQTPAR